MSIPNQRKNVSEKKKKENRDLAINSLVAELTAAGAPGEAVQLYTMQIDGCNWAWLVGSAAADLLQQNGEITSDEVFQVALAFAKNIAMKITHAPPKTQGGLLVPTPQIPPGASLN